MLFVIFIKYNQILFSPLKFFLLVSCFNKYSVEYVILLYYGVPDRIGFNLPVQMQAAFSVQKQFLQPPTLVSARRRFVPQYFGESRVFSIQLFCIDERYETRLPVTLIAFVVFILHVTAHAQGTPESSPFRNFCWFKKIHLRTNTYVTVLRFLSPQNGEIMLLQTWQPNGFNVIKNYLN